MKHITTYAGLVTSLQGADPEPREPIVKFALGHPGMAAPAVGLANEGRAPDDAAAALYATVDELDAAVSQFTRSVLDSTARARQERAQ